MLLKFLGRKRSAEAARPSSPAETAQTGDLVVTERPKKKKVLVIGSSHIFALAFSIKTDDDSTHSYDFKNLGDFCPGSRIVIPVDGPMGEGELKSNLAEWLDQGGIGDVDYVLLTISGTDWQNFCLTNRTPRFDITLPFMPDLPSDKEARPIPYAEMHRQLELYIRHIVMGVPMIRARIPAHIPVGYIEPPPPIGDNDFIKAHAPYAAAEIEQHGVSPPALRMKMYQLHSHIVAEACRKAGVHFIRVPNSAKTPEGYLPPIGYKDDPIHANPDWGLLMIHELDRQLPTIGAA
jgi:hypothetical protein